MHDGVLYGECPEALLAAEMRHGAHFAGLDENAAVANGCAELDNLVVACRRAASRATSIWPYARCKINDSIA